MGFNANNFFPYNEMKHVVVDGQDMVRIPRIYVRNEVIEDGPLKGKSTYHMSKTPARGTHVHPAFMNQGVAAKALDLSCYEASKDTKVNTKPASVETTSYWQDVNRDAAITASKKRNVDGGTDEQSGWHCWDIYCQSLLARLMLFEFGTTGFGIQEDGSDYTYRGIHQPAGNPKNPTWLPGLGNIADQIYIYDMNGMGTMVNTGLKCPGNGWPTHFSMLKGPNFDLGDVFIADAVTDAESDGACSDYQRLARNGVQETGYFTGYRGPGTQNPDNSHGMFAISQETFRNDTKYGSPFISRSDEGSCGSPQGPLRFRLAHFVM